MKFALWVFFICGIVSCSGAPTARQIASTSGYTLQDNDSCTPDLRFCVYFSPQDSLQKPLLQTLKAARKSIRISLWDSNWSELQTVLSEKLKRGISVEILQDFEQSTEKNSLWNQLKFHRHLTRYRVPVLRGTGSKMHNTLILVDDQIAALGSIDLSKKSLTTGAETLLLTRDSSALSSIRTELDEMREMARLSCDVFSVTPSDCGRGTEKWDLSFEALAKSGRVPSSLLKTEVGDCSNLHAGLLNSANGSRIEDVKVCINDPRYILYLDRIAKNEHRADGSQASKANSDSLPAVDGVVRFYSGPEDNLEQVWIEELSDTLSSPKTSFSFSTLPFMKTSKLASSYVDLQRAGVRVRMLMGPEGENEKVKVRRILRELGLGKQDREAHNSLTALKNPTNIKYSVVRGSRGLRVMMTSAVLSPESLGRNDENLLVVEDEALATLFLRHWFMVALKSRYKGKYQPSFQQELELVSREFPCVKTALGLNAECRLRSGDIWRPAPIRTLVSLDSSEYL